MSWWAALLSVTGHRKERSGGPFNQMSSGLPCSRPTDLLAFGDVAGVEVAEGARVFGEPDNGVQIAVEVAPAGEGQRPIAVVFPGGRLRVEGERGRILVFVLDANEEGASVGVHGVGGDDVRQHWGWEIAPPAIVFAVVFRIYDPIVLWGITC